MSKSIHDDDVLSEPEDAIAGLSRKTFVTIMAVVVVLAATGGLLLFFTIDEGGVTSIDITTPSRSQDVLTFAYTINTGRASAAGTATLTVVHNGTTTLTKPIEVRNGGGRLDVRLAEFAVGNGNYTFNLDYKGVRGSVRYEIGIPDRTNYIVTSMAVVLKNETWVGDGHIGAIQFSTNFYSDQDGGFQAAAPPGATLVVSVRKNAFLDGQPLTLDVSGRTFVSLTLNVSLGPGIYTVDAQYTNQWVKPEAAIKEFNFTGTVYIHNKPRACMVSSTYHGNNANSFTITADASCSTDDTGIVQYNWLFGDNTPLVTNNAIPTEGHTYPSSTFERTYQASVEVIDSNGVSDTAYFTVTTSSN